MLRRRAVLLCPGAHRFKTAEAWDDVRGAFDVNQAADRLGISAREAQGLMMPQDNYTFFGKGRRYPASLSRNSRPGSKACSSSAMFPLYTPPPELKHKLKRSFRHLTTQ